MTLKIIIWAFYFSFSPVNSQNIVEFESSFEKQEPLLSKLLISGQHKVKVMILSNQSDRQTVLMKKQIESINQNFEWFKKYLNDNPQNKALPYHKNFGLTPDEYNEYHSLISQLELKEKSIAYLDVKKDDSNIVLTINRDSNSPIKISLNLKENTVNFNNYSLTYSTLLKNKDSNNIHNSPWIGHYWSQFVFPQNEDYLYVDDQFEYQIIHIKVIIGKIDKTGETYIQIQERKTRLDNSYVVDGIRLLF